MVVWRQNEWGVTPEVNEEFELGSVIAGLEEFTGGGEEESGNDGLASLGGSVEVVEEV